MESYAAGETEPALLEETIADNFDRTVGAHPDREALVEFATGRRWTYRELNHEVDLFARGLIAGGIAKGDRVGVWSPNCAEWTIAQYATAKIGAILVNVNPSYRTHEFTYAVNQSGLRLLIAAESFKTSDYRSMIEETAADSPGLERVVYIGTSDWADVVAAGELVDSDVVNERMRTLRPDDPINIQYTSGTTGRPKGATLSHRNILNNGYFVTELINFTEHDRLCIPVPFYHCFGMVMGNLGCTSHGATMVIPAPGFDPEATLRAIAAERCTGVYGVPTMFIAMQNHPSFAEHDLSSLRTGIMAGSVCPVEVMKRCIAEMHMEEVSIAYGMTETSPVSCQTRADDDLDRRTSTIGRVHPHVEIKVVDPETGETVERGQPGEFCTRGYSVMLGYWEDEEKTREAIDADGWMHTGDLAEMRDDGYANIVGRIKDLVIRGGENIYPREIEDFLYQHPDIEDVQVIGVPDEKYGEELCAWVKMKAGATPLDADAVRAFATGKLAHYKIPRYVLVVDDFPMTVTGKIRKVQMRDETAEKLGLAYPSRPIGIQAHGHGNTHGLGAWRRRGHRHRLGDRPAQGLRDGGVDVSGADLVIGTSAGSVVGAGSPAARTSTTCTPSRRLPPPAEHGAEFGTRAMVTLLVLLVPPGQRPDASGAGSAGRRARRTPGRPRQAEPSSSRGCAETTAPSPTGPTATSGSRRWTPRTGPSTCSTATATSTCCTRWPRAARSRWSGRRSRSTAASTSTAACARPPTPTWPPAATWCWRSRRCRARSPSTTRFRNSSGAPARGVPPGSPPTRPRSRPSAATCSTRRCGSAPPKRARPRAGGWPPRSPRAGPPADPPETASRAR